ncbi:lysine-specific demethylase REF6-like [Silene latifolia]|uniref:lysine-specific demethylase REF6-like n=1 Tax=Silene latifolia TaxID=37657 RepID=UPI003D76B5AE
MGPSSEQHSPSEVFSWLKTLPVAPEYHPSIQEFQDPISYIFKIENEASKFGICKIVPPVPPPSKKSVISNFNKSISLLNSNNNCNYSNNNSISEGNPRNVAPTFTTRQQQVGFCPRKQRPIQKSVWQSGENYTLQQFETKAKNFEKNYLKNHVKGGKKTILPLEIETLYWRANGDRPFSVEYANDMPGSAFAPMKEKRAGDVVSNVGESAWNMRGVARANGSLLRFMKEEIPGVTSPMVYVAMMFSWFAWHVEDHDLHSLNYLHLGNGKTWYGVPRDAALAFEEVIRFHGFGEEINPLVTFATLGEKTTVMSPEVLMNAGVPCCRLVQNAGEFVVTFPRAYHSGFSHGFNCGEASNIATPEWLRFAKEAAIRRAAINYPPMVSHFQLLYDLALAIRLPAGSSAEPRSSRLKDKKKGEGELLIKQMFVQDVMHNNELLYTLGQGSEVVLLPHNSSEKFVWSNLRFGLKYKVKPGLPISLHSSEESTKAYDDIMLARDIKQHKAFYPVKAKLNSTSCETQHSETETREAATADGLSDRGLFSCVKCGIWTFACVAIVQPKETAAQYLMSADASFFKDWVAGSESLNHDIDVINGDANRSEPESLSGFMKKNAPGGLYDVRSKSAEYHVQSMEFSPTIKSDTAKTPEEGIHIESKEVSSALGLLAMTYGNSSDSEEDDVLPSRPVISEDNLSGDDSWDTKLHPDKAKSPNSEQEYCSGMERSPTLISPRAEFDDEGSPRRSDLYEQCEDRRTNSGDSKYEAHNRSAKFTEEDSLTSEQNYPSIAGGEDSANFCRGLDLMAKTSLSFTHGCDEDSSRMHVFCLEHAAEVEKQLQPIGGVHVVLLCHPDYPNVQFEAMKVAEEMEIDYDWKDVTFSEATKVDEERIQLALQSEEATPKNGDWAVKLGINLFYSAILSRSPLYSKQMPYNSVIYGAFGCTPPSKSSPKAKSHLKGCARQRKVVVAGKWCGKVWMSNQVHPLLLQRDLYEEEKAASFCLASDEKLGRKPDTINKVQTTSSNRKLGKKRKLTVTSRTAKKMKFAGSDPEDSLDERITEFLPRSIRKPKIHHRLIQIEKHHEEESLDGLSDEKSESLSRRSARKPKKTPSRSSQRVRHHEVEESQDSLSEDSPDDEPLPHQGPLRRGGSKPASKIKGRRKVSRDVFSDDSLDAMNGGSKPAAKTKGRQRVSRDVFSDDSVDAISHHRGLRNYGSRVKVVGKAIRQAEAQAKDTEDSDSEGPLSDESLQEHTPVRSPEFEPISEENEMEGGPSSRLRKRISKPSARILETKAALKSQVKNPRVKKFPATKNVPERKGPKMRLPVQINSPTVTSDEDSDNDDEAEFRCDIEGCTMSFESNQELLLHKRNVCPVKECGKKFFSHKYLVQHRRVHMDDRPLKCPWKGCKMTFKWAWARTEHIRVHTGARPYVCNEPDCGQTFRFVSDFSRHKRKTGHSVKKAKK